MRRLEGLIRYHVFRINVLFAFLLLLLGVLGAAHILWRTSAHGPAIHTDSAIFLSMADNLIAGNGLRSAAGHYAIRWPLFVPFLLAFFNLLGADPVAAMSLTNIAAFGLLIVISGLWLSRRIDSRLLAVGASAAIMTSSALSYIATYILAEPLFILFTILALMQMETFLNGKTSRISWAMAIVCTGVAAVVRYNGIVVIGSGVLLLLLGKNLSVLARLKRAAVYGAMSSIPLAVLLARNWIVRRDLMGDRGGSRHSLADLLGWMSAEFGKWTFPLASPQVRDWLLLLTVLALVAVFWVLTRQGQTTALINSLGPTLPFSIFTLLYLVFLITGLQLRTRFDVRFLAPLYIPLLFIIVLLLDRLLLRAAGGRMTLLKRGAAVIVLIGFTTVIGGTAFKELHVTAQTIESGFKDEFNLAYRYDVNSGIMAYMKENPMVDSVVYSNNPFALSLMTGTSIPWPTKLLSVSGHREVVHCPWLAKDDGHGEEYIVWLARESERYWPQSVMQGLVSVCKFEPVIELSDGGVYRVILGGDAVFRSAFAPVVNEAFSVGMANHIRVGLRNRGSWVWERGNGAGWTRIDSDEGHSARYTPTAEDIGYRLRAYIPYTDSEGNAARVITPVSAPVQATRWG